MHFATSLLRSILPRISFAEVFVSHSPLDEGYVFLPLSLLSGLRCCVMNQYVGI